MYTHMHTKHTYTLMHIHKYIRTHIHILSYTLYTYIHETYIHILSNKYIHKTYTQTHIYPLVHTFSYTYIHT